VFLGVKNTPFHHCPDLLDLNLRLYREHVEIIGFLWHNDFKKGGDFIMRKILDKMFENKKLAFWLPIIFAILLYLLFLLFGKSEYKNEILVSTLIVTVFWFFGSFLVVFFQVKNPRCSEWLLNIAELIATVMFTLVGAKEAISFIISGFQYFNPVICAGIVTYSSISWAHNKRAKVDE
jgi:hypothetical protein